MEQIKIGLSLFSEAVKLAKTTKDLLPESKDKDVISQSLESADKAARLAEVQVAQALGYQLCKCTFPPQIMLSKGYKQQNYNHEEEYICSNCGKSNIKPPAPRLPSRNSGVV